MSKQTSLENLLTLMARFSSGASLEEIMLGISPPVARRTLQRWIALLVKDQKLIALGAAIEFLIDSAKEIGINRYTILNLHTL